MPAESAEKIQFLINTPPIHPLLANQARRFRCSVISRIIFPTIFSILNQLIFDHLWDSSFVLSGTILFDVVPEKRSRLKNVSLETEREKERVWSDVINKALTRRQLHLQFFIGAVGRRFQPDRNDGRGADVLVVEGAGRRS